MNDVLKTIKSRRSVRAYKPEQINQEELDIILEAGVYAPSAHNQQPWHFTVVQNQELLQLINQKAKELMAKSDIDWIQKNGSNPNYMLTYHAPTLVVVSGRKDAMAAMTDCSAAIQNMLLAAESLEIGSVWLGLLRYFFQQEEVRLLEIPEGYEPMYGVALGYKLKEGAQPAPKRNMDMIRYIK